MSANNVLVAHFPRAAMGYAQSAVDEFVRQIGERLEEMQIRIDELTEQNGHLKKQATSTQKDTEQSGQREVALANAMLAIEQRRLSAETEIEGLREQARRDGEGIKESARREAEGIKASATAEAGQIVGRAKYSAEQMMDEAAAATAAEEQRLQGLLFQYDRTVDEVRRSLEMQLSMLPAPRTYELPQATTAQPQSELKEAAPSAVHAPVPGPGFEDMPYDDEFIPQSKPFAAEAEELSEAA